MKEKDVEEVQIGSYAYDLNFLKKHFPKLVELKEGDLRVVSSARITR